MHMPIYILGHVYGLKLILFSGMGGSKFRLGRVPQYTDQLKLKPMTVTCSVLEKLSACYGKTHSCTH